VISAAKFILGSLSYAGLVALPFTLFFAWSRIGYKVAANHTWRVGRRSASGPSRVTLVNMKDRPIAIFGIHAVADNLSFNLKNCDPPLILKGMESMNVDVDDVSARYVGDQIYDWKPPELSGIELTIYLSTSDKIVRCRRAGPPTQFGYALANNLTSVVNSIQKFNGIVILPFDRFAIIYKYRGDEKTAIIDDTGLIDWHHAPNQLRPDDMLNEKTVQAALKGSQLTAIISEFVVHDLKTPLNRNA
jgi:hypothetical protein